MISSRTFLRRLASIAAATMLWVAFLPSSSGRSAAVASGAVATGHPAATRAAIEAFEAGGNAIDAAIAAALTLGVADGNNSGIGGGCFALVRLSSGRVLALDGRETAPAAAHRDMFLRDGRAVSDLSLAGPLAAGVPGELAVLDLLARRYSRLGLARPLENAARVAEDGFVVSAGYAAALREEAGTMRRFPATAAIFLGADGEAHPEGFVLRQEDLARTYRELAAHGIRWFYRGPFARLTGEWMKANGGLLTQDDFRSYRARRRTPLVTDYHEFRVVGFPPPSSGGIVIAQSLNILEHFPMGEVASGSAEFAHLAVEAMKPGFADRAYWLGDPDFTRIPEHLVSKAYGATQADAIRLDAARAIEGHSGTPDDPGAGLKKHTTHFSTADSAGNWVAITATINTAFGSKVVVPGTGVLLNNQMDDFAAQPGVPNYFGLLGAEANAVEPRKRPLSSMSPTILMKDGTPILAVGAAGGPTIISQTLLAILRVAHHGMTPLDALAAPRVHHQWRPEDVVLEKSWDPTVSTTLEARGHRVRTVPSLGSAQAVGWVDGRWSAAADPRLGGSGAVWNSATPANETGRAR